MEFEVTLEGDKRVATRIGDHLIMTDQPLKQGGGNSAPAPYDLFIASIGTCAGFYIQSYCSNKGIDASGIRITLALKHDDKTKKVNGFVTRIHVPEEFPEHLRPVLQKVAQQCAVKKTIMNKPEFVVETVSTTD